MNRSTSSSPLRKAVASAAICPETLLSHILAGIHAQPPPTLLQACAMVAVLRAGAILCIDKGCDDVAPTTDDTDISRWQDDGGFNWEPFSQGDRV